MKWNQTGGLACKERNMQIRSFAMLLPCGISLFSGVEFVCCPKNLKSILYATFALSEMYFQNYNYYSANTCKEN